MPSTCLMLSPKGQLRGYPASLDTWISASEQDGCSTPKREDKCASDGTGKTKMSHRSVVFCFQRSVDCVVQQRETVLRVRLDSLYIGIWQRKHPGKETEENKSVQKVKTFSQPLTWPNYSSSMAASATLYLWSPTCFQIPELFSFQRFLFFLNIPLCFTAWVVALRGLCLLQQSEGGCSSFTLV